MGSRTRQIPLAEFRRLITTIPSRELARVPPESLPDHIPLDLIENAPPDVAATIETLIFQRQSSVMHDLNTLRDRLGEEAVGAYDMAALPRTTASIRALLEKLRDIQQRLRHDSDSKTTTLSPQEALDELEALASLANDVSDYYRKLLAARKALRKSVRQHDADLLSFLKKIDRKLRRRCALHRNVLDQYHSQKLVVTVQVMRDFRERILIHDKALKEQAARRQLLEQRLQDVQRKARQFPANTGFRHLLERLRDELDALQRQQRVLPIPLGEEDLELWLDVIVDHRLLRSERDTMERLQQRAESLYLFLLRHYYKLQTKQQPAQRQHQGRQADKDADKSYSSHARHFLTHYFRSREQSGITPYWVPEIYRLENLRQLEKALVADQSAGK